jgi:uncharacterized membrane protein
MELPQISLPKIDLPFDIPVLLHPPIDHFLIALPVVVLLIEVINVLLKRRVLSGLSLFLIILSVFAALGAYLTGVTDGSEAAPLLGDEAKKELLEHKLLGTYLMLFSGVLFLFKVISMLSSKAIYKVVYIALLIVFVAGLFKQGEEGGELVYEYGLNVEHVKDLDDRVYELEEALEEAKSATVVQEAQTQPSQTDANQTAQPQTPQKVQDTPKPLEFDEVLENEAKEPQIATH